MAKVANVFGRLEAFTFSVFLYVIGYIQMAGSNNVKTFASAQIFYAAGSTGLQILQQIFIADTSDLLNRALFSSLPDIPFLITVWVGPPIAQSLLGRTTWRWGYGIWTIVLPVAFLPLALALFLNRRKAARLGLLPPSVWKGQRATSVLKGLWYELDVMGLLLLSAAISLILIPLTLAATAKGGWHNPSIIAMLVVGCVCLVLTPLWEMTSMLAPRPFLSLRLLSNRTVLVGCVIGFFYFRKHCQPCHEAPLIDRIASRLLHLRPALLFLVFASRARRVHHRSGTCHANLFFHFDGRGHLHLARHQVHETLQVLHHRRFVHLPPGSRSHDPLPDRG